MDTQNEQELQQAAGDMQQTENQVTHSEATEQVETGEAEAKEQEKAAKESNPLEIQRKKFGLTLKDLAEANGVSEAVLKYVLYTPEADLLTKAGITKSIGRAIDMRHEKAKAELEAATQGKAA